MFFPLEIKGDLVIINAKGVQMDYEGIKKGIAFFIENSKTFKKKKMLIIDHGSKYTPSWEDGEQFSSWMESLLINIFSRIAFVVTSEFHYGLGKVIEILIESSQRQFRVFKDEQEARAWLDS